MSRERLALESPARAARLLAHGTAAVQAYRLRRELEEAELRGREAAAAVLDAAARRTQELEEASRTALARAASELALEIARVLLRREIARDNYDVERIVRETLAEAATGRNPCVVHLHPADHARLAGVRFRSGTRLQPDEGVARGCVHVETSLGLLVRDLDCALESIQKRLLEELA